MDWDYAFSPEEWEACLKVLAVLKENPNGLPDPELAKGVISKIYRNARRERRKETEIERQQQDLATKQQTYIFNYQTGKPENFELSEAETLRLNKASGCYACGNPFHEIHHFYYRLCPDCAALQFAKRQQTSDLKGRIAIVTGGRIKVGFATALKLLRDGATLIVTTRFPNDVLMAFSKEPDFANWENRLVLYGLDLVSLKSIDTFVEFVYSNFESLDILVNNAAQTIKYGPDHYLKIISREHESALLLKNKPNVKKTFEILDAETVLSLPEAKNQIVSKTDIFCEPLDERPRNSWTAKLSEIGTTELLEVNLVNNIAPFLLNSKLRNLMEKSSFGTRFIVNVTSSEGQFSYTGKTVFHPHTNMTKAALNMMTRTSADDFAESDILMNSVDVGWVSTGNPIEKKERLASKGHVMPLDIHDAASRIYDPIAVSINSGVKIWGKLLKNYKVVDW